MFHRVKKMHPFYQGLFAILIGFAVVLFWRGIWGLLDLLLFPEYEMMSYVFSAIIGLIILALTHHVTRELKD